jgi:hypothetical protein
MQQLRRRSPPTAPTQALLLQVPVLAVAVRQAQLLEAFQAMVIVLASHQVQGQRLMLPLLLPSLDREAHSVLLARRLLVVWVVARECKNLVSMIQHQLMTPLPARLLAHNHLQLGPADMQSLAWSPQSLLNLGFDPQSMLLRCFQVARMLGVLAQGRMDFSEGALRISSSNGT